MKRARPVVFALVVVVGLSLASAIAVAEPEKRSTDVDFTHWRVFVLKNGVQVGHNVEVGDTFKRCPGQKLLRMDAYFKATGPSSGPDRELWSLNGHPRDIFDDSQMGSSGFFEVNHFSDGGLPDGKWVLHILYPGTNGKDVGHASIRIKTKAEC